MKGRAPGCKEGAHPIPPTIIKGIFEKTLNKRQFIEKGVIWFTVVVRSLGGETK